MAEYFSNYPELSQKIKEKYYRKKDLKTIVNLYNRAIGSNKIEK